MSHEISVLLKDYIQLDDFVVKNFSSLVENDEFYSFPLEVIARWCKAAKFLEPSTARKLLEKGFVYFKTEVYQLLHYLTIKSDNPQSAAHVISALEGQLCQQVVDRMPIVDFQSKILYLENEIMEKKESIQQYLVKIKELEKEKSNIIAKKRGLMEENDFVNQENHDLKSFLHLKNQEIAELCTKMKKFEDQNWLRVINIPKIKYRDEGIFFYIRNEYGNEFLQNGFVEVTSSSNMKNFYDNDYNNCPKNVLKNDDSIWRSRDVKNSWIQFDFKTRSVSLKSYFLETWLESGPHSLKIEGSNDLITFTQFTDDGNGIPPESPSQHITIIQSKEQIGQRFRYIRITQGDEGSWENHHHSFVLKRVEFFGTLYI